MTLHISMPEANIRADWSKSNRESKRSQEDSIRTLTEASSRKIEECCLVISDSTCRNRSQKSSTITHKIGKQFIHCLTRKMICGNWNKIILVLMQYIFLVQRCFKRNKSLIFHIYLGKSTSFWDQADYYFFPVCPSFIWRCSIQMTKKNR